MANALMLPEDATGSGELHTIAGMPGVWRPGVAYLPEALGLSEDDARMLTSEVASPLVWVDADAPQSEFEGVGFHAPTSQEAVEATSAADAEASNSQKILTDSDGQIINAGGTIAAASAVPAWVDQAREKATALSLGERPLGPREKSILHGLETMKRAELLTEASDLGIEGSTSMTKAELVEAVSAVMFGRPLPTAEVAEVEADETTEEASS